MMKEAADMDKYIFGVDLGGTNVKIGLFSIDGELKKKWQIPTRTTDKGNNILPDIAKEIRTAMAKADIATGQIEGIGIGVPGPVDNNNTVYGCVNLGWDIVNIRDKMNRLLPEIPKVVTENDAKLATLGEVWKGAGKGYDIVVMLTLGTGIGGGIIVNNRIFTGAHGGSGEWGHMNVETNETDICGCGNCGCLEQYASARGIVRFGRWMLKESYKPSKLREMECFTAKDICDLARDGEEMALDILEGSCTYLGKGMCAIAEVVDPEVFLIGGGMSRAGDILLEKIKEGYEKFAIPVIENIPIKMAELGNDAGIFGCMKMVLD